MKKQSATVSLMLLNILIFFLVDFTGGSGNTEHMVKCGAIYAPYVLEQGQYYRLFTGMFLHFGMEHLANNMLVLFVLGQRLEPTVGKIKFLLIYFAGGLCGNILSLMLNVRGGKYTVSAGASGAVFAIMGAMIYVVIRCKGRLQDLSVRQILIMAGFSLYFGFASSGVDNIAHVGGMISGFFLAMILFHGYVAEKTE